MINSIRQKINNKYIGIISGVISAFNYAFYPALIIVLINGVHTNNLEKIALGFGIVAAKESFTFFISMIFTPKVYLTKLMWTTFKTKWGWLSVLAGSFGGPIGYSLLTVASIFIGAATPDAINWGMIIIFTTLLERFLLKRKISKPFAFGITIALFACVGLAVAQGNSLTENGGNKFTYGFLFAIGAAVSWSLENILADYVLTRNTAGINSQNFLGIKLFSSAIIAIPLAVIISYATTKSSFGWDRYTEFYTNWKLGLSMIFVAVFIFGARIFFFISIKFATAKTCSALQTLQLIFAPILIIIVKEISGKAHPEDLAVIKIWWFWVTSVVILVGILITNIEEEWLMGTKQMQWITSKRIPLKYKLFSKKKKRKNKKNKSNKKTQ